MLRASNRNKVHEHYTFISLNYGIVLPGTGGKGSMGFITRGPWADPKGRE